jgi:hypothetical protein
MHLSSNIGKQNLSLFDAIYIIRSLLTGLQGIQGGNAREFEFGHGQVFSSAEVPLGKRSVKRRRRE